MNGRAVPDLEVNGTVRRVLVRHQIDLGWLSFHTCRGTVHIQGDLLLLPGSAEPLTPAAVGALFDEISRSPGVNSLAVDLRNWIQAGLIGGWQPAKGARGKRASGGVDSGDLTYIIE